MDKKEAREMFREMRRSNDPQQRKIGNAELMLWEGLQAKYGPLLDNMIASSIDPEEKRQLLALKLELADATEPAVTTNTE
ncbi:MAG TPA: hypothetical protein VGX68_26510 [Thermoanaerobaculia bacterium]|jgi:hypothetical protein|nr:hypothetical protein [Thermoanaerobaculia bacterium]